MAHKAHKVILAGGSRGIQRDIKYGAVFGTGLNVDIHTIQRTGKAKAARAVRCAIIQAIVFKCGIQRHQVTGVDSYVKYRVIQVSQVNGAVGNTDTLMRPVQLQISDFNYAVVHL